MWNFIVGFFWICRDSFNARCLFRGDRYEFYLENNEVLLDTGSIYQINLTFKNVTFFEYRIDDELVVKIDEYRNISAIKDSVILLVK